MKSIGMVTHNDDAAIPDGMAALVMNNNGFVGTSNGWPFVGQPALYPEAQANAIMYAWNSFDPESLPNLAAVPEEVQYWWDE